MGGLGNIVLKTATVATNINIPSFETMTSNSSPIISVVVEPKYSSDLQRLDKGLKLLNYADPCVQVVIKETGEHIIVAAGEVHLEICLKDLRERYANIELDVTKFFLIF